MNAEKNNAISLHELLNGKTVTILREFARSFYIKGVSAMRKPELISVVAEGLKEVGRLEELLYVVDSQSWDIFRRAAQQGSVTLTGDKRSQCRPLVELCYLSAVEQEDQTTVSVPAEICDVFQSLVESGFLERKARYDLLDQYALAATNLYGVISQDDFVALFNRQNKGKTSIDEVFSVLIRFIALDAPYCFWEDYLVSDDFAGNDFADVPDLIARIGDKPRYIPDKQELLRHADPDYYEQTKATKNLKRYLMEKLEQGSGKADEIVGDVCYGCMAEAKPQAILRLFDDYDIKFTARQLTELMPLITAVSNSTRLWSNNGHTPNEIFDLFERDKLLPLPKQARPRKIGRNEPCPCGSGKKYKRCCGR